MVYVVARVAQEVVHQGGCGRGEVGFLGGCRVEDLAEGEGLAAVAGAVGQGPLWGGDGQAVLGAGVDAVLGGPAGGVVRDRGPDADEHLWCACREWEWVSDGGGGNGGKVWQHYGGHAQVRSVLTCSFFMSSSSSSLEPAKAMAREGLAAAASGLTEQSGSAENRSARFLRKASGWLIKCTKHTVCVLDKPNVGDQGPPAAPLLTVG